MCRWTRNKSIFRTQHMLLVVQGRPWAVRLQRPANCGGMGGSKASDWVWRSNCYHTWQCLVWDPVVHTAYVSGWSSVRQSDRVWRVTRQIRPCQRMCLTDHRTSLQHNDSPPLILSDPLDSPELTSGVLLIEYRLEFHPYFQKGGHWSTCKLFQCRFFFLFNRMLPDDAEAFFRSAYMKRK